MTIPLVPPLPTGSSCQPGSSGARPPCPVAGARDPYSALLPVGLAMRGLLPAPRWALTPPFHPCPRGRGRSVLCGAFPGVAPAGRYPAPLPCGVRTFLAGLVTHAVIQPSARQGIWPGWAAWSMGLRPAACGVSPGYLPEAEAARLGRHRSAGPEAAVAEGTREAAARRSASLSAPRPQGRKRSRKAESRVSGSAGG